VRIVQGWAEVERATDEMRAAVFTERLRWAGIDAELLSQKDQTNVVAIGGLAVIRVLVPAYQFESAVAVLRAKSGDERKARRLVE